MRIPNLIDLGRAPDKIRFCVGIPRPQRYSHRNNLAGVTTGICKQIE